MKTFSIMDAAAEPFRLVGRRPLATIVWGLVAMAPGLIILIVMMPLMGDVFSGALDPAALESASGVEGAMSDDGMAAMMAVNLWGNLALFFADLTVLLVTTAIIRGVFAGRKEERAFFLRIGMTELQVAVVGVAIGIGVFFVALLAALLAAGVGFAVWQLGDPLRWPFLFVLGIGVFLGLMLLWGRVSLLAPASVHYKTFAFEEGWKLGRGKTWSLLGLWLVLFLIAIMVGLAFMILLFIVLMAVGGGVQLSDPEAVEVWFEGLLQQPNLLAGIGAVLLIPLAWLQGFSQALFTAPFAHVVQAVTQREEPAAIAEEFH